MISVCQIAEIFWMKLSNSLNNFSYWFSQKKINWNKIIWSFYKILNLLSGLTKEKGTLLLTFHYTHYEENAFVCLLSQTKLIRILSEGLSWEPKISSIQTKVNPKTGQSKGCVILLPKTIVVFAPIFILIWMESEERILLVLATCDAKSGNAIIYSAFLTYLYMS